MNGKKKKLRKWRESIKIKIKQEKLVSYMSVLNPDQVLNII